MTEAYWKKVDVRFSVAQSLSPIPSWDSIIEAFDRLDNADRSQLTLTHAVDSPTISVAGGNGRYFVTLWNWEGECFEMMRDGPFDDSIEIIAIGGQLSRARASCIVRRALALQAILFFYDFGEPDPTLSWRPAEMA